MALIGWGERRKKKTKSALLIKLLAGNVTADLGEGCVVIIRPKDRRGKGGVEGEREVSRG